MENDHLPRQARDKLSKEKRRARRAVFLIFVSQHFFTLGVDLIHSDEHTRHALEAAQQSIVLLKNEKETLPLKKGGKIAVLGPHSDGHDVFLSNYHGSGCLNSTGGIGGGATFDCIQSPLSAITVREKPSRCCFFFFSIIVT
jgi:beta-glucosidase-like glycosyl hydrolase|eukprot:COSAG06_NODE_1888_length_8136_cov_87.834889_4_plen_142_part_00